VSERSRERGRRERQPDVLCIVKYNPYFVYCRERLVVVISTNCAAVYVQTADICGHSIAYLVEAELRLKAEIER